MTKRHDIAVDIIGIVAYFHAEDGAKVEAGDLLVQIECMKVLFDYRAPANGTFHATASLGETVGEGDVIATVTED